jgi:DMSO/TMAO reductase YedYZ molybdopterin-dependent catalytic subunit
MTAAPAARRQRPLSRLGSAKEPTHRHRAISRLMAAAAGLVAAAAGLAVAELLSGMSRRLRSPVLDVGDRAIDKVPSSLKEQAIEWFGTSDKKALLIGIGVLLAVYAAVVGIVWLRHDRRAGLVGVALFGLLGSVAAQASRVDVPWWSVLPSVAGAATAAAVLGGLERLGSAGAQPATSRERAPQQAAAAPMEVPSSRRRFMVALGVVTVGAGLVAAGGRRLAGRFSAAESRAAVSLPVPARARARVPAGASVPVQGVSPFITPNSAFYRIDTALIVPQVPADTWSLRIHGMVDRPRRLSFDELLARDLVESDITLTCVSNEVGGSLVGNARWLGARLDDLLEEVGVDSEADQIVGRSVDGYTCGFPVSVLDGRDALIAVGMNGEPLPLSHGFPARLVVPGLYGYVSATKWLTEIELTRFDRFDQYWVPRGWDAIAPIKTQSRIDTPRGLAPVAAGLVPVAGVAWAQTRGIRGVEVRVDDGPWQAAELATEVADTTWRQWWFPWQAQAGRHTLTVRATDGTGDIQTDVRSEPMPNGATGQHQIVVLVDGGT